MTVMVGNMAVDRHGIGAVSDSLHHETLRQNYESERWGRETLNTGIHFKTQSPPPMTYMLQKGHTSQFFPDSSTSIGHSHPNYQMRYFLNPA